MRDESTHEERVMQIALADPETYVVHTVGVADIRDVDDKLQSVTTGTTTVCGHSTKGLVPWTDVVPPSLLNECGACKEVLARIGAA